MEKEELKKRVIELLQELKAASEVEILARIKETHYGELKRNLMELIMNKQIDFLKFGTISHAGKRKIKTAMNDMMNYRNKRIYFLKKEDMIEWVCGKIPDVSKLDREEKQYVSITLRSYGINIDLNEEMRKREDGLRAYVFNLNSRIIKKLRCTLSNGTDEIYYNDCLNCNFYKDNAKCEYREYNADLISLDKKIDTDGYGRVQSAVYMHKIKCADCDGIVTFVSKTSNLTHGMSASCPKCNLYHRYIKNNYKFKNEGILGFVVPIKNKEGDMNES